MALTYNLSKVKDFDKLDSGLKEVMIWATMFVGISEVTEQNYKEFYARLHLNELLFGTYSNMVKGKKITPRFFTEADVKKFIGMYTNANDFSRSEFVRRTQKRYFDDIVKE